MRGLFPRIALSAANLATTFKATLAESAKAASSMEDVRAVMGPATWITVPMVSAASPWGRGPAAVLLLLLHSKCAVRVAKALISPPLNVRLRQT